MGFFYQKFQIDDIGCKFRPIINENLTVPILSTDIIENDGCPFAGFDKRTEKKKRRTSKESRPKKGIFEIPFCINCINRLFIMKIANHLQLETRHFFLKV